MAFGCSLMHASSAQIIMTEAVDRRSIVPDRATITEATINEPTGGSYARIDLTDASWSVTGDTASYAQQTFSPSGGDYSANVYGYAIATKASGGTQRLYVVEIDGSGPYDLNDGDTYKITPNITIG